MFLPKNAVHYKANEKLLLVAPTMPISVMKYICLLDWGYLYLYIEQWTIEGIGTFFSTKIPR